MGTIFLKRQGSVNSKNKKNKERVELQTEGRVSSKQRGEWNGMKKSHTSCSFQTLNKNVHPFKIRVDLNSHF